MLAKFGSRLRKTYAPTYTQSLRLFTSKTVDFTGVWPIVATPFRSDESIDFESFEKTIDFFANKACVNGMTIVGVLGESNRLIDTERSDLIRSAVSIAQSTPICVGTSHSGTLATIKLSETAANLGASSVMVTPSREPVPNQAKIIEYFAAIGAALPDLPIVLQDHPMSTQVHITMNTMQDIINIVDSIACVKLESLPSPPKIRTLHKYLTANQKHVTILTGLGALYGYFDLQAGSDGFMTGFAFPEVLAAMNKHASSNDWQKVWQIYNHFLPLIVFEQQPGIAVRKEIYKLRGILQDTYIRHPGANSTPDVVKQLVELCDQSFGEGFDFKQVLDVDSIVS